MEDQKASGYIEQPHTADWAVKIWAPDFFELLRQATQGMYAMMETHFLPGPLLPIEFTISGDDRESLLVQFLNELLFYLEQSRLGLDHFDFSIDDNDLTVRCESRPVTSIKKEIKAVTYHQLTVHETGGTLETTIVFDV